MKTSEDTVKGTLFWSTLVFKKRLLLIYGLSSLLIAFNCFSIDNNNYSNVFILPLVTSIMCMVLYTKVKEDKNSDAIFSIILTSYFLRNSVSTVILKYDDFQSKMQHCISRNSINYSIALMCYETIVVFVLLYNKSIDKVQNRNNIKKDRYTAMLFYSALVFAMAFIAYALFSSRELRSTYFSIFEKNFYEVVIERAENGGIIYTGGKLLMNTIRLIAPVVLITFLSKKQSLLTMVLSVIVALSQLLYMTDGNALILIYVIVQLIYIIKVFEKYTHILNIGFIIGGLGILSLLFGHRFLTESSAYSSSASVFFQSYVPGIASNAAAVNMIELNHENKFLLFWSDIYSAVPFRSTLFGYKGTEGYERLSELFCHINNIHAQILPTVGESSYYFSYLGAPIYSCVLINVAYLMNKKALETKNGICYSVYTLMYIIAAMAPVFYDMRIYVTDLLNIFIFMLLFAKLSEGCQSMEVIDNDY